MEFVDLLSSVLDLGYGPQDAFGDHGPPHCLGQGQDVLLDVGSQTQHAQNLRDPSAGHALPAGDLGLAGDVAGFEEDLPLDGLAEEFDNPGRLGLAPGQRASGA